MAILFSATLFLSAALSFAVQPMIGKMVLPLLGGAPAVWNTCIVFFQSILLLGYAYAHWATRRITTRFHMPLHLLLMLLPAAVLPIAISQRMLGSLPTDTNPIPWLLGFLALTAGLPVLVVSTTAPLLQKWFAGTNHANAGDPYFLYAASNAGSMLGLLSYPVLVEPHLRLAQQSRYWAVGYIILTVLVLCCAIAMWRNQPSTPPINTHRDDNPQDAQSVTWPRRLRWMVLAFVPSSLMLGVTTYITTDVSPVPLLWVVPLALYLLTFILVFTRRPLLAPSWLGRAMCLLTVVLIVIIIVEANQPAWLIVTLHLLMFFAAAMVCHSALAKDRPTANHLTDFYLCLSVGGVMGGIMNAIIAPTLFNKVWEYPLVMLLACAVRPVTPSPVVSIRSRRLDFGWPLGIGLLTAGLILFVQHANVGPGRGSTLIIFGVPALLSYRLVTRPLLFALSLAAVLAASSLYTSTHGRVLLIERDFFGVLRVTLDPEGRFHQLIHGNTIHGRQSVDPGHAAEPLVYYYPTGPVREVFEAFYAAPAAPSAGVIGLGAGSLAAYAHPGHDWTFYEIDPAVARIARNPSYFTFLQSSRAKSISLVLGDARLRLHDAPDHQYGLLVLDAFSSDSIPIHLLTREAVTLYLAKLAEHGIIAFHITNRRLDLKPVVANVAADAKLVCLCRDDNEISEAELQQGKAASVWVAMARHASDLGPLADDHRWQALATDEHVGVWSDDFSHILTVLKWE